MAGKKTKSAGIADAAAPAVLPSDEPVEYSIATFPKLGDNPSDVDYRRAGMSATQYAEGLEKYTPKPGALVGLSALGRGQIELAVSAEEIAARIETIKSVAVRHIHDRNASPVDDILPRCIAELDALARIIPTKGNTQ